MDGAAILDWIFGLMSWVMIAIVAWVFIALYTSMRRKGKLRIAEIYWWFLTVQAVVLAGLSGIKVYDGYAPARALCVMASLCSIALIWARINRPYPKPAIDEDDARTIALD
jgi:hypothetical protein